MAQKLKVKDLQKLTIEELEALSQDLDAQKQEIIEQKRMVAGVLSDKVNEDAALARLATMSDGEKRALLQHLQVEGIESTAEVGTPGSN
jgi:Spy/CpxP family protein refolding chaperone